MDGRIHQWNATKIAKEQPFGCSEPLEPFSEFEYPMDQLITAVICTVTETLAIQTWSRGTL